jgi:hypothetical protein
MPRWEKDHVSSFRGRPRHYHKWSDEKRKAHHRKCHLWQNYKMTPEEYDEILGWQKGVCCICGGTNPSGKRLAVDHDHVTGQRRNLLCASCNKGLGLFKDDPELLENAMLYMQAWKEDEDAIQE